MIGIGWGQVIDLSDDRAARSAAAASENDMAASDVDRFVRVRIGIDEKFSRREEDDTAAIGLGSGDGTPDGALVGLVIIREGTIGGDIEHGMGDIGHGLAEVVIARVGEIGQDRFCLILFGRDELFPGI